jgi:hypothetical protein
LVKPGMVVVTAGSSRNCMELGVLVSKDLLLLDKLDPCKSFIGFSLSLLLGRCQDLSWLKSYRSRLVHKQSFV